MRYLKNFPYLYRSKSLSIFSSMEERKIQIRCKNNKKTQNFLIGSPLSEVFSAFDLQMEYGPITAKVNNKVEGMHYRVYKNKEVEFLDMPIPVLCFSSSVRLFTVFTT